MAPPPQGKGAPGKGPTSTIRTERYTSWKGTFKDRRTTVRNVIMEGFRHNLANKWVLAIVVITWIFNVVFPLLGASFGGYRLVQDPEMGAIFDPSMWEGRGEYDIGFPLSQTIDVGGTAVYNLSVMNLGDRSDILEVSISGNDQGWPAHLLDPGTDMVAASINFSLPVEGLGQFKLIVQPPPNVVSGSCKVTITALSKGSTSGPTGIFSGTEVTKEIDTVTIVGHQQTSPFRFAFTMTSIPMVDVEAETEAVFKLRIENTGSTDDAYTFWVEGLPDEWDAWALDLNGVGSAVQLKVENLEALGLRPGESRNFTVRFDVPKYPMKTNMIGIVAKSTSDPSLTSAAVAMVKVHDIPKKDMTASVLASPFSGVMSFWFLLFALLLAAFVGSKAIANDMSEKSYTLYFARPITKLDYIAMKFGTVGMTMLMATLIPITVTYIGLVALSSVGTDYILGHVWVWGALFLYNIIIIIVLTSLALAFSALTSRRFYAAFGLVVTFFMSTLLGTIIVGMFNNKNGTVVSIGDSIQIVGAKIFGVTGIKYNYPWELNLATLIIMSAVATAFVIFKIWKTELSE